MGNNYLNKKSKLCTVSLQLAYYYIGYDWHNICLHAKGLSYACLFLTIFCFLLISGLCRTSEIFGVSEYVLGKLQYTEDKAFQGLSVTAHKWIPIAEVRYLVVLNPPCLKCMKVIACLSFHPFICKTFIST